MIKESTIAKAIENNDITAIKQGLIRSAKSLIEKENLFADLRKHPFAKVRIEVPRANTRGNVKVIITRYDNPYSDPGAFFNSYARKDSIVVKTISKKRLILWNQ